MKNKIIQILTLPLFVFFISFSSSAANLNIAFFASSSENGYNQATWEGVKKAASEAGNVNAEIFNGEFNATLQYGQIEDIIASGKFDGFVNHYNITNRKIDCAGLDLVKLLNEVKAD